MRHRLDCMHAPASVPVVWSKISIADAVPVTLALAVALRMTDSPESGAERSVFKKRVLAAEAAPSDAWGMLGITGERVVAGGAGEAEGRSVVSSHAAGELRRDFAGSAGHGVSPSGRDG